MKTILNIEKRNYVDKNGAARSGLSIYLIDKSGNKIYFQTRDYRLLVYALQLNNLIELKDK